MAQKTKRVCPSMPTAAWGMQSRDLAELLVSVEGLSPRVTKPRTEIHPAWLSKPGLKGTSGAEKSQ